MKKLFYLFAVFMCLAAFQAPADVIAGAMAPVFTLHGQDGKDVSLTDFRGKWVVLYFYPKDFTQGCSLEAHNFQADLSKYRARNTAVVGVSVDSVGSHQKFCTQEGLDFKLLSDEKHTVSETYGSTMKHDGVLVSARNTFLIDPEGVIRKTYIGVNPAIHSSEVLGDLDRLQKSNPAAK